MKISIITPVKNLENYISETIESVLNQRGDFDLEYIIMDGKSDDNTLEICYKYQRILQTKSRPILCNSVDLMVFSASDGSLYDALSRGLQMVTGDIISYMNGDDLYMPNAFNCVAEIFAKFGQVKWLTGNSSIYNQRGHITNFRTPWQFNSHYISKGFYNGKYLPIIQQESVFWRRECNASIDFIKLKTFRLAGDYFIWHSFAVNNYQLYIVDTLLGGFRFREGQLSNNKPDYFEEFNTIKTNSNILDKIGASVYWFIEKFIDTRLKKKFSKSRIRFKSTGWELQ